MTSREYRSDSYVEVRYPDNDTRELVIDYLVSGGDERLTLGPDRLNKYGCSPQPRDAVELGSCSASSCSERSWAAAIETSRRWAKERRSGRAWGDIARSEAQTIRDQLYRLLTIDPETGVKICLTPSGTDVELLALHLVARESPSGLVNIVVGPYEVGSGTPMAAAGRHFSAVVPSGELREPGEPVDAWLAGHVDMKEVLLRNEDGSERTPQVIDGEIEAITTAAVDQNKLVMVHVVAHSKTGVHAPRLETLNRLASEHPDYVVGIIDAAQGRISRRGLRTYLSKGYMVIVTASKFYGAPPFCGALLVPPELDPEGPFSFPEGFSDFFSKESLPPSWESATERLPDRPNMGLLLRWNAGIAEMDAYYETPGDRRLRVLRFFEKRVPEIMSQCPIVDLLTVPQPVVDDSAERLLESKTTVFSIAVAPDGMRLDKPQLAQWVTWLNTDLSDRLPATVSQGDRDAAARCFHVGQPVIVGGHGRKCPDAIIRIALGGALITDISVAGRDMVDVDGALSDLDDRLQELCRKLELIHEHQARLGAVA